MTPNFKLLAIALENFKSFVGKHNFDLDRTPGLYFIAGKNLLEPDLGANGAGKSTIWDAVFWALTGRTLRVSRPGDSIVPWSLDKGKVLAAICFEIDGASYVVRRTRGPNRLLLDERDVDQSEIDRLLRISDEALRRTLIIGQFSQMFLDLKAEQQSTLFSELLDLDFWLGRADKARTAVTSHSKDLADAERSLSHIEGRVATLEETLSQERILRDSWKQKQREQIDGVKAQRREKEETLIGARQRRASVPGSTSTKELAQLEELLEEARRGLRVQQKDLSDKRESLSSIQAQVASLESQIAEFDDGIKRKICPSCGQKIDVKHIVDKHTALGKQRGSLLNLLIKKKDEVDAVRKVIVDLDAEAEGLEHRHKELRQAERRFESQVSGIDREISQLEFAVGTFDRDIEKLRKQENPHIAQIETLEVQTAQAKQLLADTKAIVDQTAQAIERFKFWVDGFKQIRLDLIDSTLLDLEIAANRHMGALGLHEWQIKFATEKETKSGSLSHTFSTFISSAEFGQPSPWEGFSGGETTRLQLAVTFGLSEVLLGRAGIVPNIEILDEPSRHLSDEGIDNLLEMLRERAVSLGRAIYLVDHRMLDSGYFDGVLTVVRDQQGSHIQ